MRKNLTSFCILLLLSAHIGAMANLIAPRNLSDRPTDIPAKTSARNKPSPVLKNTASGVTLYGNLIFANSWGNDGSAMGIYQFDAVENPEVSLVHIPESGPLGANGGATLVDGKYLYCITYSEWEGTIMSNELICYDIDTWEEVSCKKIPLTTISTDMTWNPVDGEIYGAFYNTSKNGYVFGTLDLETGEVDNVCDITLKDDNDYPAGFVVIAANSVGEVYGISQMGDLYKFDIENGSYDLIGATGFKPAYQQSGCFDFTTKQLYWAACDEDFSGIYQVDTNTGAATLLGTFDDLEEFVGLYSLSPNADLEGPGSVTDVTVDFEGAALSGTISFTLPTVTVGGNPLSGDVDYTVEIDNEIVESDTKAAGSTVEIPVSLAEGSHLLNIVVKNANGAGPSNRTQFFVGTDTPAAAEGVTAQLDDNSVTITWNAVTQGEHNGYIDLDKLSYRVVRQPDNQVVADQLTDTTAIDHALPDLLGEYYYEVSATADGRQSTLAQSPGITLGSYLDPPYSHQFRSMDSFDLYTIINANHDDKEWTATVNGAQLNYNRDLDADDWIVSPPMNLKAGHLYTLTVTGRSSSKLYAERFEVKYGTAATAEALTNVIIEPSEFTTSESETFQATFSPQSDGLFHIGIHGISEKFMGALYIYSLEISAPTNALAPAAASEMNATAAPEGALSATITAIAPSQRANGTELTTLVKAEISNDSTGLLVGTIENPQPGQEVSITDSKAANGFNTYSIVFFNEAGEGYEAECTIYIGIDTPIAVINPRVVQRGNEAVISWEAPTTGINGGYIDPAKLTYRISQLKPVPGLTASEVEGLSYTDKSLNADEGQILLSYQVSAESVAGEGEATPTNSILFGTPYPAPFTESWPNGVSQNSPWVVDIESGDYADWAASQTSYSTVLGAQDNDDGWIAFSGPGSARLVSPKVDISKLANPVLKVWVNNPDGLSQVNIQLSTDLGETWKDLFKSSDSNENTWTCHSIDLGAYRDAEFLQIGILASTEDWLAEYVMVDNLRIYDQLANDLVMNGFTGPESVIGAQPANYSVTIYNDGAQEANDYKIAIYSGDKLVAEQEGKAIQPDTYSTFSLELAAPVNASAFDLTAKIEFEGDLNAQNNEATLSVTIEQPKYPTIGDLNAEADGNSVTLTWSKPALTCTPDPVTDDIESYEEWTIGGIDANNRTGEIGEYTVYDGDGAETALINAWCPDYPNKGAAMAFQVMSTDSESLSTQLTLYGLTAHSGKQLFACWSLLQGTNNDYLILPELKEGNKSLSFWARSIPYYFGASGYDKFEILYSTSDNAIESFEVLEGSETTVPDGFEQDPENGYNRYSFELPADAKYVAIHCISSNKVGLLIDDIEFIAASVPDETLVLNGYNLYRNNELYKQLPDTEGYVDTEVEEGNSYTYNVTAVFDKGESGYSNTVTIDELSGIESLNQGIKVYAGNHAIVIENADNHRAEIFKIDGNKIFDKNISHSDRIAVDTGIYIVRIDNHSFKVAVQ